MQLNPSKPFAGILATLFFFYLIYILVASDPLTRLNRLCEPVFVWPERIVVAGTDLFMPSSSPAVKAKFDDGFGTCRRWLWNAMYARDYQRMLDAAHNKVPASAGPGAGQ
jgi:hypothetical protein